MSDNKFNFLVVGSTGLCGSAFIKYLNKYKTQENMNSIINSVVRNPYGPEFLDVTEVKDEENITTIVEEDSSKWATETFSTINTGDASSKRIYLSGLGTTKATAGGIENQRKVDVELNYQLAKKAKELGYTTCVLVSSAGANSASLFPYFKMKGELEDKLQTLGFENLVVLRPGALLGPRLKDHNGLGSNIVPFFFELVYGTWFSKFLGHPVYGDSVGKAGVQVAINLESKNEKKGVTIISSKEIIELTTAK